MLVSMSTATFHHHGRGGGGFGIFGILKSREYSHTGLKPTPQLSPTTAVCCGLAVPRIAGQKPPPVLGRLLSSPVRRRMLNFWSLSNSSGENMDFLSTGSSTVASRAISPRKAGRAGCGTTGGTNVMECFPSWGGVRDNGPRGRSPAKFRRLRVMVTGRAALLR